jgi:hypothetical protein
LAVATTPVDVRAANHPAYDTDFVDAAVGVVVVETKYVRGEEMGVRTSMR